MTHFRQSTRSQLPAYQYAYGDKTVSGVCLQNVTDYSPFGVTLDGRTIESDFYRYSFNGKEKTDEWSGEGNSYDFGARMYDSRVGKWLSRDSKERKYATLNPYNFVANSPLFYKDPDGKEIIIHYNDANGTDQVISIKKMSDIEEKLKDIQNPFVKEMYTTLNYLKNERELKYSIKHSQSVNVYETLGTVEHSNDPITGHRIDYDPYEAIELIDDFEVDKLLENRKGNGKIQSPALGFFHEILHFTGALKLGVEYQEGLRKKIDPLYHNKEEKRVGKIESRAAKRLGEPQRTNHGGIPRKVQGSSDLRNAEPRKQGHNVIGL
jgi:RHS repeat-associated protein